MLDLSLHANPAKDQADAEPLHLGETVAVPDDGQDHGEHLAGDGDGDEDDRAEVGDGVDCCILLAIDCQGVNYDVGGRESIRRRLTNKDLSHGTTSREAQHVPPYTRMPRHEAQRGAQLARARAAHGLRHTKPLAQARGHQPGTQEQIPARQRRAHHVVGAHHLRAAIRLELGHNPVLRAVGEPVKEQVDAEQQHAPRRLSAFRGAAVRRRLLLLARMQREDGHAHRHGQHHQVFVEGVLLAEQRDVQKHNGQELAALGERVRNVVDVRQRCVANGRRQRLAYRDEQEREDDAPRGDDGRDGLAGWRRCVEVQGAGNGGEEGLDDLKEDGELPFLGRAVGGVRVRCR